jgi:hypothetical protein
MAQNNDLLYNAALAGFIAGQQLGRPAPVAAAASAAASNAFALAVDTAIPADPTISVAGVPIAPTTGAIQALQLGKSNALQSICAGLFSDRSQTDATTADYNALAAQINTLYQAVVANLKST